MDWIENEFESCRQVPAAAALSRRFATSLSGQGATHLSILYVDCVAQVQRKPGNVEAWRLLGTVHAENDDDTQAIAAMAHALKADPTNAEVCPLCHPLQCLLYCAKLHLCATAKCTTSHVPRDRLSLVPLCSNAVYSCSSLQSASV